MAPTMSARERSRWLELLAIQDAALDLTLTKGFGAFTMDELADAIGMPRRTLFKRVGDKMSAVLGVEEAAQVDGLPPIDTSLSPLDAFLALVLHLVDLVDVDESVLALHAKMRQVIAQEPRLADEMMQRTHRSFAAVAELIADQYGWDADDPRTQVLSRVVSILTDMAIAKVLAESDRGRTLNLGEELHRLAGALKSLP